MADEWLDRQPESTLQGVYDWLFESVNTPPAGLDIGLVINPNTRYRHRLANGIAVEFILTEEAQEMFVTQFYY